MENFDQQGICRKIQMSSNQSLEWKVFHNLDCIGPSPPAHTGVQCLGPARGAKRRMLGLKPHEGRNILANFQPSANVVQCRQSSQQRAHRVPGHPGCGDGSRVKNLFLPFRSEKMKTTIFFIKTGYDKRPLTLGVPRCPSQTGHSFCICPRRGPEVQRRSLLHRAVGGGDIRALPAAPRCTSPQVQVRQRHRARRSLRTLSTGPGPSGCD